MISKKKKIDLKTKVWRFAFSKKIHAPKEETKQMV
jgi:hypothetical protein